MFILVPIGCFIDCVESHPPWGWRMRFAYVYLGNPAVFLLYFVRCVVVAHKDPASPLHGGWLIGQLYRAFRQPADVLPEHDMNCFRYLMVTLPPYVLWFWFHNRVAVPLYCCVRSPNRTFNVDKFCLDHYAPSTCPRAHPGVFTVLIWWLGGWGGGGTALPCLFAGLLLISIVCDVKTWLASINGALEYRHVASSDDRDDPNNNHPNHHAESIDVGGDDGDDDDRVGVVRDGEDESCIEVGACKSTSLA